LNDKYMAEETGLDKFWWGKLRKRKHLQDLGVDERSILICILKFEC
jgi:hypothetical protein